MVGELPRSVRVNGKNYRARTDYRDIIKILLAFSDPELEDNEKLYVCLYVFYRDFDRLQPKDYEEALKQALAFIDQGDGEENKRPSPRVMDWEQDAALLFPAVNKVAGFETRSAKYIHWWTFMGYYMEISDGVFSNVLHLRLKKAKGKKLEKWESEFWNSNKRICALQPKLSAAEQAEKDRLNALLG